VGELLELALRQLGVLAVVGLAEGSKDAGTHRLGQVFEHVASLPSRWGRCRPHPSQTRTCRIPASGSSRSSFARDGVAMEDQRLRQGISIEEYAEAIPAQAPSARPPG